MPNRNGDGAAALPDRSRRLLVASAQGDYPVLIGHGLLSRLDELVQLPCLGVITEANVAEGYGEPAARSLGLSEVLVLPAGESHKLWPQVENTVQWALDKGLTRAAALVAVGGGVLTDSVGFAAAIALRGVPWVAVPTTLLAMVDASVGAKTGINTPQGKNLIGAFWAPRAVIADLDALVTLDRRELLSGLAEVIKHGVISADDRLLELAERAAGGLLDRQEWVELVATAVEVKAEVVAEDERESGRRKALNLGHTLGHAIEAAAGYGVIPHGQGVRLGLEALLPVAETRGMLSSTRRQRIATALDTLGPRPDLTKLDRSRVLEFLSRDKKADLEGTTWVLPSDEGVLWDQRLSEQELELALSEIGL